MLKPPKEAKLSRDAVTREERRSRRKRAVRAITVSTQRMSKREIELGRVLYPDVPHWRPVTRGECALVTRPCPFVSCKHHLYIDVNPKTGAIKMNFPDLEPDELEVTCALDVADLAGSTLEEVAATLNITRERARQIEERVLVHLKVLMPDDGDERVPVRAHQKEDR